MTVSRSVILFSLFSIACGGSSSDDGGGSGGTSGSGGGGATGGSGGTGGGTCSPACGPERQCCGGACVNTANDPKNCGACGTTCTTTQWCNGSGACETTPCETTCGGGALCCGSACCGANELCCDPQGPVVTGPACTPPSDAGTCPQGCAPLCVCASPDSSIATPAGARFIADLRVGDLVYSVDHGRLRAVPILKTNRVAVKAHRVVRLTFASGARIEMSGRHPTADGRTFQNISAGDSLDGEVVVNAETVSYQHDATYDILPQSDTGTYFASGVLVGSSLAPPAHVDRGNAWACK